MHCSRLILLLPVYLSVAACSGLMQTASTAGDSLSAAASALTALLKSTPYDAPGTAAAELSDAALVALNGPAHDRAPERDARLAHIEQAQAVAGNDYDRAWLQLEHGKTLTRLDRCDEARPDFQQLLGAAQTPAVERLRAQVELDRIERGVCWTGQNWSGYRYRPAPPYPTRIGHPPIDGEVELLLHVTHRGGVAKAVVLRSSHKVLELQTLLKVGEWRFQPLKVNGVAIPFVLRQKLWFQYPRITVEE